MSDIKIQIKNLPQIQAAFRKAPYLMASGLRDTLTTIGKTILQRSLANVPVDTGRLSRSHYMTQKTYSALNYYLEVGTGAPKNKQAYYDIYVHEGTRYQKAQPYLKRAVDSEESNIDDAFERAVQRVLDRIGAAT